MKPHLLIVLCHMAVSVGAIGSFWQISDLHVDGRYSVSGDVRSMCHGNLTNVTLSRYGNFSCDAPWDLVLEAVAAMNDTHPEPDFILWTGDIMAHLSDSLITWDDVYTNLRLATELIVKTFPNSKLIPVIGNHDVHPANVFPAYYRNVYQNFLTKVGWNLLVPPEQVNAFRKGGYYARDLTDNHLKIIVLNTNLYLSHNRNRSRDPDPGDQLSWLEEQLKSARKEQMMVLIAAHAPPGYFERNPMVPFLATPYSEHFIALMVNFADVILSQIFGHTHTDSFRLFKNYKGEVKSHAFIAPSISPWRLTGTNGVNPSFRLYTYDLRQKLILDYEQYFLNLTQVTVTSSVSSKENEDINTATNTTEITPEMGTDDGTVGSVTENPGKGDDISTIAMENQSDSSSTIVNKEPNNSSTDSLATPANLSDTDRSIDSTPNVLDATSEPTTAQSGAVIHRPRRESGSLLPWKLLYRATQAYGVSDLRTNSLLQVYQKLKSDTDTFDRYYYYNSVGVWDKPCDATCRKIHLCAIMHLTRHAFEACWDHRNSSTTDEEDHRHPAHGISTTDKDDDGHHHHSWTEETKTTTEDDDDRHHHHSSTAKTRTTTEDDDHRHHGRGRSKRTDMLIIGMSIGLFIALLIMTGVASVFCVRRRFRSGFRYQKHVGYNSD